MTDRIESKNNEDFCDLITLLAEKYRLDSRLGLAGALRAKAEEYQGFLGVVSNPALAEVFEQDIKFLSELAEILEVT